MTDLRGGRFTALLPAHLRNRETEALAYVVGRQVDRLLDLADRVPFYAVLSHAPEAVLDLLAVELRAPAYRDDFPLEVKRTLVRDALLAYAKMGTPAAVDRTLSAIFGNGNIEEWFGYGGEPHHFRAVIQAAEGVSPESLEMFRRALGGVKRLSSWLDELITVTTMPEKPLYITPVTGPGLSLTKLPALEPELPPAPLYVTPILGRGLSVTRLPFLEPERETAVTALHPSAAAISVTETHLPAAEEFETNLTATAHEKLSAALSGVMETKLPFTKEEHL